MKKLYTLIFIALVGLIGNAQTASISYPSPICINSPTVAVLLSGEGNYLGGTFSSSPVGLLINSVTGEIVTHASVPGNYLITYSVPAAPPDWIAISTSTVVTIVPAVIPGFDPIAPVCIGAPTPELPTISNNGISGSWAPTTTNNYAFTPNAGQCATPVTMTIDVFSPYVPVITTASGLNTLYVDESNEVVASLELISGQPEGYTYQWSENTSFITDATDANYLVDTASPTGTTRFYRVWVTHIETGCHTVSSQFPVVQSNGLPPPEAPRYQSLASGSTLAHVVVSGTGIRWYASSSDKNATTTDLPLSTLLTDNTTYYASQTVDGNESIERQPVTVTLALGIVESELTVTYSPNPVKGNLLIKSSNIIDAVSIINAVGQVITAAVYNQPEIVIDMNDFRPGIFFVKVNSAGKMNVLKVIKE